jgi:flagellar basal-body rod modification protein FlgD
VTVNDTTSTSGLQGTGSSTGSNAPARMPKTLGQDAFLTLLVTQLENQDPTKPKDDTEFISQLAVFSQLEKLTQIADSVQKLTDLLSAQAPSGTDAAGSTNTTQPKSGA